MPQEISPKDVQKQIAYGFDRFKNFKAARLMYLRNYTGPNYDRQSGVIGGEPLNMIFNAIRVLIPNIVFNFPKHTAETSYLAYKDYAELLGLALNNHDKQINVRDVYSRVIVDAIFTLGIMKTGLAQSGSIYALNPDDHIEEGTIYTEGVDFDNFVVDPRSTEHMFRDAAWFGDRLCVPRSLLLDSGNYKNDLVERLPQAGDQSRVSRAKELSMRAVKDEDLYDTEDYVEVCEIWVPGANALITTPGDPEVILEDFLRIDDYYGPKSGPYTLLALTPPVPGNPLPVPSVGVWNDLHVLANRMAKKIIEQAERQKDIVTYKRSSADDAEEMRNAGDGEAVAVDDPDGVRVQSFGGQQNSNEIHLSELQGWFNLMAGNPEQVGGNNVQAKSATAANILQQNAGTGLEFMKDMVYQAAKAESTKRAWYMHTDPMINLPLTRRQNIPAQYAMGLNGPIMVRSPQTMEQQVVLTPEARRGDFLDFTFEIQPESMGRIDSKVRFAQAIDFATKIMPAVMTTAQVAMQLQLPFSAKAFILRMAKDSGIEWMDEVFYDPDFQMHMQQQMMAGPNAQQSKGQPGNTPPPNPNMIDQILQNGQPANIPGMTGVPGGSQSQQAQSGANFGQRELQRITNRGIGASDPLSSLSY